MPDKLTADMEAMTIPELVAHIAVAQTKLRDKQEAAARALLAKWKAEAKAENLPFESILPGNASAPARKRRPSGDKLPVKFKGPKGEEWSGRGRLPQWLADAEKQGRKREEFKI